jgi:hypothetical protein
MRARSLVLLAVAACATNPDPRTRPVDVVARDGHGAWIVVTARHGAEVSGELIAIDLGTVGVLGPHGLVSIAQTDIESARLYAWDSQYGTLVAWGGLGTLSTISHGFFLALSAPAWIVTTAITAAVVSHGPVVEYPDDSWAKLAIWARFPQGTPPGVFAGDLVQQHRTPPPAPPPATLPRPPPPLPLLPPPGAPPAGSGAGSGSAGRTPDP